MSECEWKRKRDRKRKRETGAGREQGGDGKYKRYRVAKTHRMPYLFRSFSAKEPYN